jgi:2-amino-4-hydroxy-6-hydroxymethyldihydropteridine diphosphokinase
LCGLTHRTHLAAGSRDGDRLANLSAALAALGRSGVAIARVSAVYETEPVDLPGDRSVFNAAIEAATELSPLELMAACLEVEEALGRRRADFGPRPLDLDILFYDDLVLETPALLIPHPRLHMRRFVLAPLAEIAPDLRHPVLGTDVAALLERCVDPAWVRTAFPPGAWWTPSGNRRAR